jgi:hypothetical protein
MVTRQADARGCRTMRHEVLHSRRRPLLHERVGRAARCDGLVALALEGRKVGAGFDPRIVRWARRELPACKQCAGDRGDG